MRPRALSPEQAREVVAEAKRGVRTAQLARRFHVSSMVILAVVSGRGYNDVTGVKPYDHDRATCAECRTRDVQAQNVDLVRALLAEVECHECHCPTSKSVGAVLSSRGRVRCTNCDRRRK